MLLPYFVYWVAVMFLNRVACTLVATLLAFLGSQVHSFAAICEPNFTQKLCVAGHAYDRHCTPLPDSYNDYQIDRQLHDLFELSPGMVQKGFCSVSEIRIVKNWGTISHGGFVDGTGIFVDRDFLFQIALMEPDRAFERNTYYFPQGSDAESFELVDHHQVEKHPKHGFGGEFVVRYEFAHFFLHELAHILDFNWEINTHAGVGYFGCFHAHQVLGYENHTQEWRYISIDSKPFSKGLTSEVYSQLLNSEFASFYSMSSPREDFAELFVDYVLLQYFDVNYTIEKSGEVLFDRALQFQNPNVQKKLNIVRLVLSWSEMTKQNQIQFANDRGACRGAFDPR